MTKEEYQAYAKEQEDWAPGWDAIDDCFQKVYPDLITDLERTKNYL